jgi:hypothetical protein
LKKEENKYSGFLLALLLVIVYTFSRELWVLIFVGVVPILLVFIVVILLKYPLKNPKLKNKSFFELLKASFSWAMAVVVFLFFVLILINQITK